MTDITGMWEVLEALEAVIKASDPNKRDVLAATIDAYAEDFPDDFYWALGGQAPALLHNLMLAIDSACRSKEPGKTRGIRLMDRKPQGSA